MSNNKIIDGNLEILLEEGETNTLLWNGKSEARDPASILLPFFNNITEKLKNKKLIIKFEKLEYLNSSTVLPIIDLIKKLESNGVDTMVTYDKESKWQIASFKALDVIVQTMNHIKIQGV